MKIAKSIFMILILVSCTPFSQDRVLDYETQLVDLVLKLEPYNEGIYDLDEIDEFIIEDVKKLGINQIVKNQSNENNWYSGFTEGNDSLVIFIQESSGLGDVEKRIIYDYSINPRNFGNLKLPNAAYNIVQLDHRLYYSETGFD